MSCISFFQLTLNDFIETNFAPMANLGDSMTLMPSDAAEDAVYENHSDDDMDRSSSSDDQLDLMDDLNNNDSVDFSRDLCSLLRMDEAVEYKHFEGGILSSKFFWSAIFN